MTQSELSTESRNSPKSSVRDRYFLGLLFLVTASSYLRTLRFGFVFDDKSQIFFNPFIKAWHYVPEYFVNPVWRNTDLLAVLYYRPLLLLWLRLNYSIFGTRAFGWHVTEILLHLVVTWLVYRIVDKMTGQQTVAWLTALIFSVHPIHHEVVAWISGATESLFAALFLFAFLAYLKSRESSKTAWMIFSSIFYGLALLSKETAIVLPILVFAHAWIADRSEAGPALSGTASRLARSSMQIAFYIPVALTYLIVRHRVLSGSNHSVPNASFLTWLLTLPSVLFFYVKNWFLPIHLSEFYDLPYQVTPNLAHVLLPALIVSLLAWTIWMSRDRMGARNIGYAAIWVIVPLLPALNTLFLKTGEIVHDRYFYVPSIGAALLVALAVERVGKGGPMVFGQPLRLVGMALALTFILASCTVQAATFWENDYTLFTHVHEIAPQNSVAASNLSAEWINRGELEKAQTLLEKQMQDNRDDSRLALNLGHVMYLKKQYAKAEEFTRQSLTLDPNVAAPYVSLGQIQLKQNLPGDAQASMRRAVELNPYDANYHTIYGIVLELNGNCTEALIQFKASQALVPGDFFTEREMLRCGSTTRPMSSQGVQPGQH